jgi:hypothetical protein
MRDIQRGVAAYYAATARGGDLGSIVRHFLADTQTINDWLTNAIADKATYLALFTNNRHPGADSIEAAKYVRNVAQHILHVVKPSDTQTLVGGALGFRAYAQWEEVPADVHAALRPGTRALKPKYDQEFLGKELVSTMMSVLRFYAGTAPDIVHRDSRGEWTGFPLMNQPGMTNPLHPEEPSDSGEALAWLNGRRPGGDLRVACGQTTVEGTPYIYGLTFTGDLSFTYFCETAAQIDSDIALGYPYRKSDDWLQNVDHVSDQFPDALQSAVFRSRGEITSWSVTMAQVEPEGDWSAVGDQMETWERLIRVEVDPTYPEAWANEARRVRRLNALVPPSAAGH